MSDVHAEERSEPFDLSSEICDKRDRNTKDCCKNELVKNSDRFTSSYRSSNRRYSNTVSQETAGASNSVRLEEKTVEIGVDFTPDYNLLVDVDAESLTEVKIENPVTKVVRNSRAASNSWVDSP